MARTPDEIKHPQGFPIRLYKFRTKKLVKIVAASSREIAVSKFGLTPKDKKKAIPVTVAELISANGYEKTNHILKEIGTKWICKEGKIFFNTVNNDTISI